MPDKGYEGVKHKGQQSQHGTNEYKWLQADKPQSQELRHSNFLNPFVVSESNYKTG